jgi:hypothetical protein
MLEAHATDMYYSYPAGILLLSQNTSMDEQ